MTTLPTEAAPARRWFGELVGLLRAELRKAATTWSVWLLLALGLLLTGLSIFGIIHIASNPALAGRGIVVLGSDAGIRAVIGSARSAAVFALLAGAIGTAGEYRHNTATQVFLMTPRRERVVAAKVVAYALVGVAFAIVADLLTIAMAYPWLATKGIHPSFTSENVGVVLGTVVIGCVLYAVLGVGLGGLVKSQIGAVIAALVWLFLVENLLGSFFSWLERWLPGGTLYGLTLEGTGGTGFGPGGPTQTFLSSLDGGLVLLAYAAAFAIAGGYLVHRRDVT